ncbi:MAG TPA: hypothetical protein VEQ42_10675, partial [Pyrinomonadaceae bacterium]|nr:hypothetical protein [Pyrinomonadaceae bacterium]
KKGWGSTVLGWFVVQEGQQQPGEPSADAPAEPTTDGTDIADELIRRYSGGGGGSSAATTPAADAYSPAGSSADSSRATPSTETFRPVPPASPGGQVDFDAVFESAGVDSEERGRVARAVELLNSLPAGTDVGVKKQIVEASLRAFGVPVEKIIEAGAEEIQALEFYQRAGAAETEQLISESEQRIRDLEQEIADVRKVMQQRVEEQQSVIRACNAKKLEVQQILEFFGQERVAAVVKASPKLQDPSGDTPTT